MTHEMLGHQVVVLDGFKYTVNHKMDAIEDSRESLEVTEVWMGDSTTGGKR